MTNPVPVCVIRKFKHGDQPHIQDIITNATMEQVGNYFWSTICSELLLQVSVALIGVSFVLIGIPFKYCLLAIPVTVALLYTVIWFGHWVKAHELSSDIFNISTNYMNDPKCCFFVAESYGKSGEMEMLSMLNKVKKIEYNFYTEKEFAVRNLNISGCSKMVVGSIAVTRSMHHNNRAWIRRMAVKKEYRRCQIATHLLQEAFKFCESRNYEGIELLTTTCHSEARNLYMQEGFDVVDTSSRSYYGIGASQDLYHMYKPISRKSDDIEDNEDFDTGVQPNLVDI